MKVILLKDIPKLGKRLEVKEVNDGYARNYLFPNKLAKDATASALKEIETMKETVAVEKRVQTDLLRKNMKELAEVTLILVGKANDQGHLFSSIHAKDLVLGLKENAHVDLAEEFIVLDKPIKELGDYTIPVAVKDIKGSFALRVLRDPSH